MRVLLGCALALWLMVPLAGADTIEDNLSAYTDETAAGYLGPLSKAFGQNLNSAYFNTAAIPQDGFYMRLELHFMVAKFGDDDRTFEATPDPDFPSDETVVVPTVVGDGESVDLMSEGAIFTFPGGLDLSSLPMGVPQLTIGSLSGTEFLIRWFGFDTEAEDIEKIELFGIGARHNLNQYFEDLPVDLTASAMYQTFKVGDGLLDGTAFSFGGQVSKDYGTVVPFASLTLDSWDNTSEYTANEGTEDEEVRSVDFGNETNLHLAMGATLNLAFVRLSGAINVASQFGYHLGIAFGN